MGPIRTFQPHYNSHLREKVAFLRVLSLYFYEIFLSALGTPLAMNHPGVDAWRVVASMWPRTRMSAGFAARAGMGDA